MPFRFRQTEIPDVVLIEPVVFEDSRGFFMETYKRSAFAAYGLPEFFVQDNYSCSRKAVLRGLHYQNPPKAQAKLVMILRGEIFEVAVDIRRGSPTYRKWVTVVLSAKDRSMLYIPVGFAHGFCVLSDEADILYKVTEEYAPEYERGICWDDPALGVPWPIRAPLLSPKDADLPSFDEADHNFVYEGETG